MDEEADLALLDQHLLKTNLLSQRMTNILGQLDNRLSRLDKTIAPLGLQPLTRKDANIESILLQLEGKSNTSIITKSPISSSLAPIRPIRNIPINSSSTSMINTTSTNGNGNGNENENGEIKSISKNSSINVKGYNLGNPIITNLKTSDFNLNEEKNEINLSPIQSNNPSINNSPADETAILIRGPDLMSLNEFFISIDGVILDLERMFKGLMQGRGGAREIGVKDLSNLVEIGFSGLTQLFLKVSKDGMGKTIDAESVLNNGPPTPPNYFSPLNTLLPLVNKITTILYPQNPTPKTSSIVQPIWDQTIATFGDMRGDWLCRCLSRLISRLEESDEGGIWSEGRGREKVQGLTVCWESLLSLVEAETLLITTLFPSNPPTNLLQFTLHAPTESLTRLLQPTLNTVKRSLSTHIYLALDLYRSLTTIQSTWDTIISKCLSMTNTPTSHETKELLSILNQPVSTLRSLSLRSFPELLVDIKSSRIDGPLTSSIADITYSTLGYLENMNGFEKLIEGLLSKSHSERSWLMGQKESPSPARNASEEGGIVNLFVADVLGTLLQHLDARARNMRRPIGQAFSLNNLSHIRNTTSSFKSDIIGPGAEDMLNKAFRDAKGQYLSEFHSLVNTLTTTHSTPRFGVTVPQGERHNLKESATQFFDKLAELENVILQYPLNRQDPDMRDRISREVEVIIRNGYEAFWGRCAGKGIEKYLRGSPDDITRRVQAMFR
ncbi:uncharacterized protein I206_103633 [Kwoniella pini CBS 10737]|uniref:Exocyst complex subunit Exo70 C-terminal domain-containing protein n=1 Tax=Kwoniella pini CBS 10737 TaxID=1296096 RepID=A0AAJ8L516_9TREE